MKLFSLSASALIFTLLLLACGGGGGGGPAVMAPMVPPAQQPQPQPESPPPTTYDTQTAFGGDGPRPSATAPSFSSVTGTFRQSAPAFGSVAMNLYTPSLASVRSAETTFNGDRYTLSVTRQGGSGFVLDTDRHYTEVIHDETTATNPVSNRPFVTGYMVRSDATRLAAAGGLIEWSRTDVTDYLAGGYWLYVDAGLGAVEMGAFIDGTDYSSGFAYDLPVTGTATYNGVAGGMYMAAAGSDTLSPGAIEFGEYEGSASLTANFGTMQIHGRVDNIGTYNVVGQHANGVPYSNPYLDPVDIEMVLHPAPINDNGTFAGSNVQFTSQRDYTITSSTGSWAGQFSSVDDSQGMPRAVAGTNAGYLETIGGSRAFLTGAFYGATERFE